jgi:hypothetical protein
MGALNRTVVAPLSSAIIAVLLAGIVVVGFDGVDRKLRAGEARLQPTGIVEVAENGGRFVRLSRDRILNRKDQIRVVEGKAVLELPHSSLAELRGGSVVTMAGGGQNPALVLDQGDLLVEAPHDTVRVDGGMAVASVAGSARLHRGVSLLAGVYGGNVNLQKNERSLGVPRYRQAAAVGTGLLPEAPDPLDLRASDEWDRRLLGEVLSLSEQLEIFGRSFEAQLSASAVKGPELFKSVIPELADAPITPALLAGRAPGENLIGLSLVAFDRGDFDARVKRVFGFRAAGASWGLVAADRDLNPNPLLVKLEAAIERVLPVPSPARSSGASGAAAGPGRGRGTGGGSGVDTEQLLAGALLPGAEPANGAAPTTSTTGARGGTKPANPNSAPPSTSPSPPPTSTTPAPPRQNPVDVPPTGTALDPVLEPVVKPLETLLSGVLDNLSDKPAGPAPSPSTTTSTTTAPTTTTTAPTTTTTTAPATRNRGGLLGGLLNVVGGLLH